jgi:NAD(P)-dependent dehydrogenase (short-subunit alcohol dehydrogenase family)
MRLANKLAVVTAAASGMGRAGVEKFVAEGATVVAVDINREGLDALAGASGGKVLPLVADLTDPEACRSFVHEAAKLLGGIDLLWNHAGSTVPGGVEQIDLASYDRTMMLNVTSGVLACAEAIGHMRRRGGGSILFTASVAGLVGSQGSPIYSAEKFAVVGYAKSLAQRFAADNVRVNVVCPGITDTPMLAHFYEDHGGSGGPEAYEAAVRNATPMGRLGRAEEIANAACFLLSDEASFVTGIAMPVDGGYTCR